MIQLFLGDDIATSVALGTAIRAAGYGQKVRIINLVDKSDVLSKSVLDRMPNISLSTVTTCDITKLVSTKRLEGFNLLVLICEKLSQNPKEGPDLIRLIVNLGEGIETILSASSADESWIEKADLVTHCECNNWHKCRFKE
ncbi:MAG: hypothetical protein TUN42_09220 [Dehalogenimonas sp.]